MKLSELSELHLAAVVAGATFLGGIGSTLLGVFLVDAGTDRQTDVQLVQLAVSVLSDTEPTQSDSADTALRAWAVDTINSVAEVKLDAEARRLLIGGEIVFPAFEKLSSDWWSMSDIEEVTTRLKLLKDEVDAMRPADDPSPEKQLPEE